jgi:UDP-glucose 6-dehydrogenase
MELEGEAFSLTYLVLQYTRAARDYRNNESLNENPGYRRRQREPLVDKLLGELKILKGRTIGLPGLAFKLNTDDLREAPAIDIGRKLVERGGKVKVHDPVVVGRFR